jgi:hypothetical protein
VKFLYDEDLVEGAVLDCARTANPWLVRRFHREREKIYTIADPDQRNAAFFQLHLDWFREWGLESFLRERIAPFANLQAALKALAFRKARSKSEEGGELYVNGEGERHGMLALRPERFSNRPSLLPFLNHELMHLNDMVDAAFGYSPDIGDPTQSPSQQRLIRERYRLLWDITIDGRLFLSNRPTIATHEQRWNEFNRAFSFLEDAKRADTFQRLWTSPSAEHLQLVALAKDPRGLGARHAPQPGGPCPLCGFPTFEWASQASLAPLGAAISSEFPHWCLDRGACKRCVEVYESTAAIKLQHDSTRPLHLLCGTQ